MRFCFALLTLLPAFGGELCAASNICRSPMLDSLASDIAILGSIPRGGYLHVLASSRGWFSLLSGVVIRPGDDTGRSVSMRYSDGFYFGRAALSQGTDSITVFAPRPKCWPMELNSCVEVDDTVEFFIQGYGDLLKPQTAVSTPSMEIFQLHADESGCFRFIVPQAGVYWVETMQWTSNGPSVELLFPVVAGGGTDDVMQGGIPIIESSASSISEILAELNDLRTAKGIPPLERDDVLDSIAGIRAENLALSGELSHFDSSAGSLQELIPEEFHLYAENISRGSGYQEAWSMILISPFHLATCISPDYSRIGLAAAVDCVDYEWQLVLVQVFASESEER